MTEPLEQRLGVGDLDLALLHWPGDGTPMLALHGWLDNAASFVPMAAAGLGGPLWALDLAGHGRSGHRPGQGNLHYPDYLHEVLQVMEALELEQVDLIGHSMGAGLALLLAVSVPERVRRLVMIDGLGPAPTPAEQAPEQLRRSLQAMRRPRRPLRHFASVDEAARVRSTQGGGMSVEAARLLCRRGLTRHEQGWCWSSDPRLLWPSAWRFTEAQVQAFLQALCRPALLVSAEQGVGGAQSLPSRLAGQDRIRVVSRPGGHHLHMEQPEWLAALIRDFLDGSS